MTCSWVIAILLTFMQTTHTHHTVFDTLTLMQTHPQINARNHSYAHTTQTTQTH